MDRVIGLIGAPTAAGAHSPGQEKAPRVLREAEIIAKLLVAGLDVHDYGDLPVAHFAIDKENRRRQNVPLVAEMARQVAARVTSALDEGDVPLVLGGDCTILLGVLAAHAQRDEDVGVLYLDAHADLNTPVSVVQGALDWMGMAHALGEPDAVPQLADLGPRRPLLDDDKVLFFAYVPSEQTAGEREIIARRHLEAWPTERISGRAREAGREAAEWLGERTSRFVVHFDLDAVDFVDFPAADNAYQRNQGLTLDDALAALSALAAHPAFNGLVVSQFNPDHAAGQGPLAGILAGGIAWALTGRG